MNFLKNRTVLGVICIAIALVICFLITPLFNASTSSITEIVRMKNDLKTGQEITEKDIEIVEVGAYNLPNEVIRKSDEVIGKFAAAELFKGEYIITGKISDTPANENSYLYGLTGEKRAISVTIPSFAQGLSGKLQSGDIVTVIANDYMGKGETVVPEELQYVEVIAATDKKGNDEGDVVIADDGDEEEADLPSTITLLVTPTQANILAKLESEGEIHVALVYRGDEDNAAKFIAKQEKFLADKALAEGMVELSEDESTVKEETTYEDEEISDTILNEQIDESAEISEYAAETEEIKNAQFSE